MRLINWREEYAVGVPDVDLEHQHLLELINKLHRSVEEGVTRKQVIESLGEIYEQISAHFTLEETFMREHRYRAFAEHKLDHDALLDDLREIMEEVEDDGEFDEARLSIDLNRWFSDHFQTHDAKLHSDQGGA